MLFAFIYLGDQNYNTETDAEKFSELYQNIENENLFKIKKSGEILQLLDEDSIIFFGTPSNKWSSYVAEYLNVAAKNVGVKDIYYYDFLNDRNNRSGNYELIAEKLEHILYRTDLGKKMIYAPLIVVTKHDKVIYYNDDFSLIKGNVSPDKYFNDTNKELLIMDLELILETFKEVNDGL